MITQYNAKLKINFFILICLMVISIGCAKTVTLKEEAGSQITFSINLASSPKFTEYNYYIIFGTSSFIINTNLQNNYFFIPGETFNEIDLDIASGSEGLNYFYSNYFYSWGGILTLKENDITLTNGPFASELTPGNEDTQHFNYTSELLSINDYTVNGNKIYFTVTLNEIDIDDTILYFSIVTSKGLNINNTQDIVSTIQFVELISNSPPKTGFNTSIFSPDDAAKIESWTVTVQ